MIVARIFSMGLRVFEFIFAVIVVAMSAHFLRVRHDHAQGAKGRLIFVVISSLWSLFLSMVWLIPFTASLLQYPLDIITSFLYFTAFAILQQWIYRFGCARIFDWNGEYHTGQCQTYRTMTALSFIAGVFWLVSAILSACVFHRLSTMRRTHRNAEFEREREREAGARNHSRTSSV